MRCVKCGMEISDYIVTAMGHSGIDVKNCNYICLDCRELDSINPSWYKSKSGIEVIDIIESFDLDYYQATAIKYILRAGKKHKETEIEDYKKALWFIERKIKRLENALL